jgi:hypothetical protein
MQRADIRLYGHRRQSGVYGGLISGYAAKVAAFASEKRLDKVGVSGG